MQFDANQLTGDITRIKAFFKKQDEPVELELSAAEIREGQAFLHTKGEDPVTYMVRANDIEIRLNKDAVLSEKDILTVKRKSKDLGKKIEEAIKKAEKEKTTPPKPVPIGQPAGDQSNIIDFDRYKKRKFVISVYPEEYDILMSSIKVYGYKRADFVLACVNTTTKGTMEKAHKKIVKSHREIVLEQQALAAKQAVELRERGEQTG